MILESATRQAACRPPLTLGQLFRIAQAADIRLGGR